MCFLGSGEFADVYKAICCGVGVVAIKNFFPQEDAEYIFDFAKEAVLTRQLNHPNLISLHGFTCKNHIFLFE